ncbi:regulatory protein GemA [Aeromonas jandaei]|uniref:gp16 family protein n=1 Tax=Aeromonas jandaei TaxID=650 RepID=UPI000CE1FD65|nr:regulatory protein GemA [Aeromonas jandaei]PPA30451.1 regulatory protein GemA [Aeromonas jandaei]
MSNAMRNGQMAKIHIAKAELGLDDEEYRALLGRVAGVKSAKELNPRQIGAVLAAFEKLGWQPKASKKQHGRRPSVAKTRQGILGKIEALLADAGRPWAYAKSMAHHMFKREELDWLTTDELTRLMQALVIDAKRRGKHENHRQQ